MLSLVENQRLTRFTLKSPVSTLKVDKHKSKKNIKFGCKVLNKNFPSEMVSPPVSVK